MTQEVRFSTDASSPAAPATPADAVAADAEAAAQAQPQGAPPTLNIDRPAWLPEKFKSPEDMAAAYSNLEQRLGSAAQEQQAPQTSQVSAHLEQAAAEFASLGRLSEATSKTLKDAGIPVEVQETYLRGVNALAAQKTQEIYQAAGGAENYTAMVQWAQANLQDGEKQAFNRALGSDPEIAKLAVTGLLAKMRGGVGAASQPKLMQGMPPAAAAAAKPMSVEEMQAIMRSPAYKAGDTKLHAQVDAAFLAEMRQEQAARR